MPYIGNKYEIGDHNNSWKPLDDISSYVATFDGSATNAVSTTNNTIRVPEHRFIQGQRVTYSNGGGGNIGGLTSGTAYYIIHDTNNEFKLATSLANANASTAINLSAVGSGTSHTVTAAFDGVNKKFKITYSGGKSSRFTSATQLTVAINNIVQRANDTATFTDGFGISDNEKIVFNVAPVAADIFWGNILSASLPTFDISDNKLDNFTGNGSTTDFTLSHIPANNESIIVTVNGVVQHPTDKNGTRAYSLDASVLVFTAAPANGDEIQVRHIGFAGASSSAVTGFYGRTGNVTLSSSADNAIVGVITATKFSGAFDGTITSGNDIIAGIITANAADIDDWIDVGNNIQLGNAGVITATTFRGDGDFVELDVDGHTNLDNVSIAGVTTGTIINATTFVGNGDFVELDVDGHTNLDNVSVAGVTTVANDTEFIFGTNSTNTDRPLKIKYKNSNTRNQVTGKYIDFNVTDARFKDIDNGNHIAKFWQSKVVLCDGNGNDRFETTNSGINVIGNNVVSGNVTAVDGTFSGNVSIGGTLTYEDVTNVDAVGLVTARDGVFIPDTKELKLGNTAASPDLKLYSTGTNGWVYTQQSGADLYMGTNAGEIYIQTGTSGNDTAIKVNSGGSVEINHITNKKLETTSTGIDVTGNIGATGEIKALTLFESTSGQDLRLNAGSANRDIFLQVNDSTLMTVRGSTGNVGINDITPDTRLSVTAASGTDVVAKFTSTDANAWIQFRDNSTTDTGVMVGASGDNLLLRAGSNTRVTIDSSGHITPGAAGTQDLGSASKEWGDVYLADNKRLKLGSDQDMFVYHDNTHGYVSNRKNNLYIEAPTYVMITSTDTNGSAQQTSARFLRGGKSEIYHSDSLKFETSATGITVTGEVAASQDYPNYRPTLDFNFAAVKKLDPRITYTRTGPASYVDEFGIVKLVGDNVPRFDHDAVTRESKGLLIEEERSNHLLYSEMLQDWSFGVGTDVFTASSGSQLSTNPDGSSPAYHYVPSSTSGHHRFNRAVTVPTLNTEYVVSVFVKRVTAGTPSTLNRYVELEVTGNFNGNSAGTGQSGSNAGSHVVYDLQNLTIHNGQSDNERGYVGDSKLEDYGNGWYRCSYVFNPGSGSYTAGQVWWGHPGATAGDSGSEQGNDNPSFYFWGASVEKGKFLTSYIPTDGTGVTRGVDTVELEDQEFTEFYNQTEGTLMVDGYTPPITLAVSPSTKNSISLRGASQILHSIRYVTHASDATQRYVDAYQLLANGANVVDHGGSNGNAIEDRYYKHITTFKKDDYAYTYDGASQVWTDTSGDLPEMNRLIIGESPTQFFLKRVAYYPKRLPNSQLTTLVS